MDKRVLNHITRKQRAVENYVACRDSQQIGLFKSDMVRYLPYYKAYAIVTPMPAQSVNTAGLSDSVRFMASGVNVITNRIPADALTNIANRASDIQDQVTNIAADAARTATATESINSKTPEPTA